MKKLLFILSVCILLAGMISCGGGSSKENDSATTDTVQASKALPPKTSEELKNIEKVDEKAISAAENKEGFFRFSSSYNLDKFPIEIIDAVNIQTIELNNYRGTSLPEEIKNFPNLSVIYITGATNLTTLPSCLPELKNLKTVSITAAQKLDLNAAIKLLSKCSNLEYLELSYSQIECTIPAEIGNMKKLKVLNISNNKITSFDDAFYTLPTLETLIISSTKENVYPYDELFAKMKNLPKLKKLAVHYSGLTGLPDILKDYPALETMQWSEEGKGWENSDAILKTTKKWDDKFPGFTVTYSTASTPFYDYY